MPSDSAKPNDRHGDHVAKPRPGRPPREAAAQLRERILEVATELLLTDGYGATSIEAIARRARVSKRTFYQRFADKPALMSAVVVRLIDRLRPTGTQAPPSQGEGLERSLVHLGSLILHAALTPRVLQLHRLIVAESGRFPELAAAVARSGGRQEAVLIISGLLMRDGESALMTQDRAAFSANQFLQMIMSLPQLRAIGMGVPMTSAELDAWVTDTVALFLEGWRGARLTAGSASPASS